MAARAGVSQSTVSYVMSGRRPVGDDVRRRVEKAMRELDYQPNAGAQALRRDRTNVIALVVHLDEDADASETMPYIDTIVEEASRRDYEVVLSTGAQGAESLERLARRRIVDAFVLMDIRASDDRLLAASKLGRPVVLFGRPANAFGMDVVDFDSRSAAELLVEHMAVTGHRRITLVSGASAADTRDLRFIREFQDGARDAAGRHALPFKIVQVEAASWAGTERAAEQIFAGRDDRLGLIARTARMTEWLVQLSQVTGVRLGEDVSLASMTTDRRAVRFQPAVTNISPQPRSLSRVAMRVLFDRLEGEPSASMLTLVSPSHVTRRATTVDYAE